MKETIINCKSKAISKTTIKVKIKSSYEPVTLICRIMSRKKHEDNYKFKVRSIKEQTFNCKIKSIYELSMMNFKLKHNVLLYKTKEYNITKPNIVNDIEEYFDIAKHYVELFSYENQLIILNFEDAAFILLKYYEDQIDSIQQFRSFNINKIFTKELVFKIKYR